MCFPRQMLMPDHGVTEGQFYLNVISAVSPKGPGIASRSVRLHASFASLCNDIQNMNKAYVFCFSAYRRPCCRHMRTGCAKDVGHVMQTYPSYIISVSSGDTSHN